MYWIVINLCSEEYIVSSFLSSKVLQCKQVGSKGSQKAYILAYMALFLFPCTYFSCILLLSNVINSVTYVSNRFQESILFQLLAVTNTAPVIPCCNAISDCNRFYCSETKSLKLLPDLLKGQSLTKWIPIFRSWLIVKVFLLSYKCILSFTETSPATKKGRPVTAKHSNHFH